MQPTFGQASGRARSRLARWVVKFEMLEQARLVLPRADRENKEGEKRDFYFLVTVFDDTVGVAAFTAARHSSTTMKPSSFKSSF